ncbi:aminotransferase class I/II-fold pyridoxal phosphate-dependent enzyme [Candidatus Gottesmanbacteria bacterium]|nr:aminotransferase class I/II-fold pyridoxal phosphate-dependent enzyme [Candidatus Gottesmanbacteria bacterium]
MKHSFIPVAKIYTTKEDEEAVASVVRSGWVLQGPKVDEFERLIGRYIGTPHAVATSSATTALHMSLITLGIGPGDEVIVPSLSFIASANCVVHAGAKPVFVDIDPKTYNLDPNKIEPLITKKTRAIIAVHQIGLASDMPMVLTIAKKHNLTVIEDQRGHASH